MEILGLRPQLTPYAEALAHQRRLHEAVYAGRGPETLLLVEHESVFTAGARTPRGEEPATGGPAVRVDRGGRMTWHGPGQLVGYPILRLPEPLDVVSYLRSLEEAIIAAIGDLGLSGFRRPGMTGVWVHDVTRAEAPPAKIAALGVRVARGITLHGFALNCSNSLAPFEAIVPCGLAGEATTTLTIQLGRTVTPAEAAAPVVARVDALAHGEGVPA